MANVLILGGGFGGVVAAERLAQQLSTEHHITLATPAGPCLSNGICPITSV